MRTPKRLVLTVLTAVACVSGAVAIAAEPGTTDYTPNAGGTYTGVRPTALGLPQIRSSGTVGANEYTNELRRYHDSGQYLGDVGAVAGAATAYLNKRLDDNVTRSKLVRTCRITYRRLRTKKIKGAVYRRKRTCKRTIVSPQRFGGSRPAKPAIVLDIDETSLSNYNGLVSSNFSAAGLVGPAAAGNSEALGPVLALYNQARARGVAVFFVTGRPSIASDPTASNLRTAGYNKGWEGLQFKGGDQTTLAYKSGARAAIEAKGYDVVANVGDQESDLDGGHADRSFKLPNPFYFISD